MAFRCWAWWMSDAWNAGQRRKELLVDRSSNTFPRIGNLHGRGALARPWSERRTSVLRPRPGDLSSPVGAPPRRPLAGEAGASGRHGQPVQLCCDGDAREQLEPFAVRAPPTAWRLNHGCRRSAPRRVRQSPLCAAGRGLAGDQPGRGHRSRPGRFAGACGSVASPPPVTQARQTHVGGNRLGRTPDESGWQSRNYLRLCHVRGAWSPFV